MKVTNGWLFLTPILSASKAQLTESFAGNRTVGQGFSVGLSGSGYPATLRDNAQRA